MLLKMFIESFYKYKLLVFIKLLTPFCQFQADSNRSEMSTVPGIDSRENLQRRHLIFCWKNMSTYITEKMLFQPLVISSIA